MDALVPVHEVVGERIFKGPYDSKQDPAFISHTYLYILMRSILSLDCIPLAQFYIILDLIHL